MKSDLPLAGIRVIDLSNAGPGPRCSRILADLGARVTRIAPPPKAGSREIEMPYHSYAAGRGWHKLGIDLKSERGRAVLLRLVEAADVFIEGFRPGVVRRLCISYDDVSKVNAKIIYCSLSGYGQTGPAAGWVGHDINYAAIGGLLATGGRRSDNAPALPGLTVADAAGGGMQGAIAILAALLRRDSKGTGAYLDVSATDGVVHLMSLHIDEYLATGNEPRPGSSVLTGRYACYDLYQARDGRWIAVGAIEANFFAQLCKALGCEHCIPHQFDDQQQNAIRIAFQEAFANCDRDEWLRTLSQLDSCLAPVNTIAEVVADPNLAARGMFREVEHPVHGRFSQVANVFSRMFGEGEIEPCRSDSADILYEVGISEGELASLRDAGIVA